jgi:hypothetical protein
MYTIPPWSSTGGEAIEVKKVGVDSKYINFPARLIAPNTFTLMISGSLASSLTITAGSKLDRTRYFEVRTH